MKFCEIPYNRRVRELIKTALETYLSYFVSRGTTTAKYIYPHLNTTGKKINDIYFLREHCKSVNPSINHIDFSRLYCFFTFGHCDRKKEILKEDNIPIIEITLKSHYNHLIENNLIRGDRYSAHHYKKNGVIAQKYYDWTFAKQTINPYNCEWTLKDEGLYPIPTLILLDKRGQNFDIKRLPYNTKIIKTNINLQGNSIDPYNRYTSDKVYSHKVLQSSYETAMYILTMYWEDNIHINDEMDKLSFDTLRYIHKILKENNLQSLLL